MLSIGFPNCIFVKPPSKQTRNLFNFCTLHFITKWIQRVEEETAYIIGSGKLIPCTKVGWLRSKVTGKRPYANAVIGWTPWILWLSPGKVLENNLNQSSFNLYEPCYYLLTFLRLWCGKEHQSRYGWQNSFFIRANGNDMLTCFE